MGAVLTAGPLGCSHLGGHARVVFWGLPPPQPGSLDDFPWSVDAGAGRAQTCSECREKHWQGFAACPISNLEVMLLIILSPQPKLYFISL